MEEGAEAGTEMEIKAEGGAKEWRPRWRNRRRQG